MKKLYKTKLALGVGIGSAIGTVIISLLLGRPIDWMQAVFVGVLSLLVFLVIPKRWIERVPSEEKKEPIQTPQRKAGNGPPSGNPPAIETPSSPGPRG